jgi:hypothetical protein
LDRFLPQDRTVFFGCGRQALAEGLRRAGIGSGDRVLFPGLIGRGVLSSVASVRAVPIFYDVDESLCADMRSLERIDAVGIKALVVVNYFGFPQPLKSLLDWCRSHGIVLIEDNAHGFLSSDNGVPLGRRGDLGVFSLFKTLSLPNGGALVDNRSIAKPEGMGIPAELPYAAEWKFRLKTALKGFIELGGLPCARAVLAATRVVRLATMASGPAADSAADLVMPGQAFTSRTARLLCRLDISAEVNRRRTLYRWSHGLLGELPGVHPLHRNLPDGVAPQGFPFLYSGQSPDFIESWRQRAIRLLAWPDHLPDAISQESPAHYRRIMFLPFLW